MYEKTCNEEMIAVMWNKMCCHDDDDDDDDDVSY
jgi:hypothetical protein